MKYDINIPGWMFARELEILSTLAELVPENGSILEVGCFLGSSTTALYRGKHPSVNIDVVDSFNMKHSEKFFDLPIEKMNFTLGSIDVFNAAKEIARNSSWQEAFKFCVGEKMYSELTVYSLLSQEFNKTKTYDLTFIDASHTFEDVLHDIKKFDSDYGLLVGDDFSRRYPEVASAVHLTRKLKTLIVFENTKLWALIPNQGYWRNIFKSNNLLFL